VGKVVSSLRFLVSPFYRIAVLSFFRSRLDVLRSHLCYPDILSRSCHTTQSFYPLCTRYRIPYVTLCLSYIHTSACNTLDFLCTQSNSSNPIPIRPNPRMRNTHPPYLHLAIHPSAHVSYLVSRFLLSLLYTFTALRFALSIIVCINLLFFQCRPLVLVVDLSREEGLYPDDHERRECIEIRGVYVSVE